MPPQSGQDQTTDIPVPARIAYQYWDGEEGPWVMIPYASIYPPQTTTRKRMTRVPQPIYRTRAGIVRANMPVPYYYENEDGVAWLPPPLQTTELWVAQQKWPL